MRLVVALVLTALVVVLRPSPVEACAPAPPVGQHVAILGEEALIVWDADKGIEHFVRSADFQTTSISFGFIVPTPAPPQLAEVDARLFGLLADEVRPPVQTRRVVSGVMPTCVVLSTFSMSARDAAMAGAPVEVLKHQRVAGYDAVVLRATDPQALSRWLAANDYEASATLAAWARPYVERGWVFTAFKVAQQQGQGGVATSPVRMSFAADRPFYPYREPANQRTSGTPGNRALRVYFVAAQRYAGALEDGSVWPGEPTYAKPLDFGVLEAYLPLELFPKSAYLTTFVDDSSPRPGTADLFFASDPRGDLDPAPIVETHSEPLPLPVELLVLVGAGV